jgi:hypothetical protein
MVDAPAAVTLAGFNTTEATPLASVSAVPPVGDIVPMVASVLKVTTAFGTTAPFASMSVAFAVAGAPLDTEVVEVVVP